MFKNKQFFFFIIYLFGHRKTQVNKIIVKKLKHLKNMEEYKKDEDAYYEDIFYRYKYNGFFTKEEKIKNNLIIDEVANDLYEKDTADFIYQNKIFDKQQGYEDPFYWDEEKDYPKKFHKTEQNIVVEPDLSLNERYTKEQKYFEENVKTILKGPQELDIDLDEEYDSDDYLDPEESIEYDKLKTKEEQDDFFLKKKKITEELKKKLKKFNNESSEIKDADFKDLNYDEFEKFIKEILLEDKETGHEPNKYFYDNLIDKKDNLMGLFENEANPELDEAKEKNLIGNFFYPNAIKRIENENLVYVTKNYINIIFEEIEKIENQLLKINENIEASYELNKQ